MLSPLRSLPDWGRALIDALSVRAKGLLGYLHGCDRHGMHHSHLGPHHLRLRVLVGFLKTLIEEPIFV